MENTVKNFITLTVDIPKPKITEIAKFINDECQSKRRYRLRKNKNNFSTPQIVNFIEIISRKPHPTFKILKNVDAIPEGEARVGILTTPTETLFEFLQLIGFPIDNDNYDKDDDDKMDLDEYQSL